MTMEKPIILVVATRNAGKTREIRSVLKDFPVELKDLNDFGPIPEPVEDGSTFEENAYKKASFTAKVLGLPALADDSGLEVEALGGAPGVHSARYAGPNATDEENNQKLLREGLQNNQRLFRFRRIGLKQSRWGKDIFFHVHKVPVPRIARIRR